MTDIYQPILETLSRAKRVLITTHVRPDGDALGSTAAMAMGLRKKNIEAEVLLLSRLPSKYAFVYKDHGIVYHDTDAGWPATLSLETFDCLLVIDTGTWSQLPGLREKIEGWNVPKLVVDHHLTQENWASQKLVITQAAAAGEIVAQLLERWDIPLDASIATALYLAIATDTGWFQFSNTRPYTMRLAAILMEAGVDTDKMYQLLYQNERAERIALQARVMQSMQLLSDNRLAVMIVRNSDFEATHATPPDTEALINVPLQIATVEVSILLTEPKEPGPIRVSLRSKGKVDVAKFAEQFAGGGHARAAGLKVDGELIAARDNVVQKMLHALSPPPGTPGLG